MLGSPVSTCAFAHADEGAVVSSLLLLGAERLHLCLQVGGPGLTGKHKLGQRPRSEVARGRREPREHATHLLRPAAWAGPRAPGRHRHRRRGPLRVLGVRPGRAVARVPGRGAGRDLDALTASHGAVAVAVPTVPGPEEEPQQPGREQVDRRRLAELWGAGAHVEGAHVPHGPVEEVLPVRRPLLQLCQR